jgi:hypothetical protein
MLSRAVAPSPAISNFFALVRILIVAPPPRPLIRRAPRHYSRRYSTVTQRCRKDTTVQTRRGLRGPGLTDGSASMPALSSHSSKESPSDKGVLQVVEAHRSASDQTGVGRWLRRPRGLRGHQSGADPVPRSLDVHPRRRLRLAPTSSASSAKALATAASFRPCGNCSRHRRDAGWSRAMLRRFRLLRGRNSGLRR